MRNLLTTLLATTIFFVAPRPSGAVYPITPPAPEFPAGAAWLNSEPFSLKRLSGRRVTLVAFLNPNALASLRALRALNRWWDEFGLEGLMIIGVHSPDFDFDRDPATVRHALKRFSIRFPVFIDSSRVLWRAYANQGWPAFYLLDPRGRIIHDQLGASPARLEGEILGALERFNGFKPPAGYEAASDPVREGCGSASAPFYLGARRGRTVGQVREDVVQAILKSRQGEVNASGSWTLEPEGLRYGASENPELGDRLQVLYEGGEALAVLTRLASRPVRLYVKQDNLWLHSGNANADIQWDAQERSYVQVDLPRLYYLTRNKKEGAHELNLLPAGKGVGVSGFEFPDLCQTDYDHK